MLDLNKRVGKNIRAIRKAQNLTIDELAERCDFQSPYLSDIERGERNITLQTLTKILNALDVNPGSILIPLQSGNQNAKEELLQILTNSLEDKSEEDIRMLLNFSIEIFKTYKNE